MFMNCKIMEKLKEINSKTIFSQKNIARAFDREDNGNQRLEKNSRIIHLEAKNLI